MLLRHTILYLPAQLLGPMFQFIAAVVWTHFLSADDYGALTYVLATHELIFTGCLAWWSQYTLRFAGEFAGEPDRRRFQATENAVMILGVPAQAVLVVLLLMAQRVPLTFPMAGLSLVCCVTRCAATHLCERARGRGDVLAYTVGQSVGPVAGFLVALGLVKFAAATPVMALAGYAVAQTAVTPWLWRRLRLLFDVAHVDAAIIRKALFFGAPLILSGGVMWFSANGIRMVVEHVDGAEAVGLLSVGWGLGQRLASVVAMLVTAAAFPLAVKRLVDGSREDALRQLAMGGAVLYGLVAPAAVGIALVTRPMVELMISQPFREATMVILPIAALAGAIRNLRIHFADQVFLLFERSALTIAINLAEVVATVGLCYAGARAGGPAGAALGCLGGSIVGTVFAFAWGAARFGLIIPWEHAARVTCAAAVMASVMMAPFLSNAPLAPLPLLVLDIVVASGVYALSLAALYPSAVADAIRIARGPRLAPR
jgi:O-antigen/teichoic acid export membrane protein